MTILSLFILVLVVCLICWVIQLIPVPAGFPFLRNFLYILVALFCIVWLLDLAGFADLGLHSRLR